MDITGALDLTGAFNQGFLARNATKEVGLYLRKIPEYDFCVGNSRDISQRQRQHNAGQPSKQGNSKTRQALAGRAAADVVVWKRLVSFRKTGLREIPQPVLHCIETLLIGAVRLTTSPKSLQVNMVDSPPYAQHREYQSEGFDVPLGHYPSWSSTLGDHNGYTALGGGGPHGELFGRNRQSRLSQQDLQETLRNGRHLLCPIHVVSHIDSDQRDRHSPLRPSPPVKPTATSVDSANGVILAKVWKRLYDQQADLAKGKYTHEVWVQTSPCRY